MSENDLFCSRRSRKWPTCVVWPERSSKAGLIGNPDETGGIAERKRAEEKGVDDTEDGAAGTDAEADDEKGEGGEANVATEGTEGVF